MTGLVSMVSMEVSAPQRLGISNSLGVESQDLSWNGSAAEIALHDDAAAGVRPAVAGGGAVVRTLIRGRAGCHISRPDYWSVVGWLADGADSPDRVATTVVADEVALRVDRRAAGAVATDVDPAAGLVAGFGLCFRGCSKEGEGGDGECGQDGFHGSGFSL